MTIAEAFLELAKALETNSKQNNGLILCKDPPEQLSREGLESQLSRAKVALWLAKQPDVTRFRAMFEEWDMARLVREMF